MNKKYFKIFERYRKRKYLRDKEALEQDFARREMHQSTTFFEAEKRLKEDYEDEVGMNKEKIEVQVIERRNALWTNRILAFVGVASFMGTSWFAFQQNRIAYDNAQPLIAVIGGNEDQSDVRIKNAGGGPAKNIFFLNKPKSNPPGEHQFVLTQEKDVGLVLAAGAEGNVNLSTSNMDWYDDINSVLEKIGCAEVAISFEDSAWMMVFYENLRSERFMTKFNGTGTGYASGAEFEKLRQCR